MKKGVVNDVKGSRKRPTGQEVKRRPMRWLLAISFNIVMRAGIKFQWAAKKSDQVETLSRSLVKRKNSLW